MSGLVTFLSILAVMSIELCENYTRSKFTQWFSVGNEKGMQIKRKISELATTDNWVKFVAEEETAAVCLKELYQLGITPANKWWTTQSFEDFI